MNILSFLKDKNHRKLISNIISKKLLDETNYSLNYKFCLIDIINNNDNYNQYIFKFSDETETKLFSLEVYESSYGDHVYDFFDFKEVKKTLKVVNTYDDINAPDCKYVVNIPLSIILIDDGAGGYTANVYNSEEELVADHYLCENGVTEELKAKILNGEDEYEHGYVTDKIIQITLRNNKFGILPFSFHVGQ